MDKFLINGDRLRLIRKLLYVGQPERCSPERGTWLRVMREVASCFDKKQTSRELFEWERKLNEEHEALAQTATPQDAHFCSDCDHGDSDGLCGKNPHWCGPEGKFWVPKRESSTVTVSGVGRFAAGDGDRVPMGIYTTTVDGQFGVKYPVTATFVTQEELDAVKDELSALDDRTAMPPPHYDPVTMTFLPCVTSERYERELDLVIDVLSDQIAALSNQMGMHCQEPHGGISIYGNSTKWTGMATKAELDTEHKDRIAWTQDRIAKAIAPLRERIEQECTLRVQEGDEALENHEQNGHPYCGNCARGDCHEFIDKELKEHVSQHHDHHGLGTHEEPHPK